MIAQMMSNASAEWLVACLGALFFIAAAANSVLGIFVKHKQLNEPTTLPTSINPQPLIVAMEKEFVHRSEYERRHADMENQVKETRIYAHDEVHAIRGTLNSMGLAADERDGLLHALDERTKTHTRQLDAIDMRISKMADRIADKVESLLRVKKNNDS